MAEKSIDIIIPTYKPDKRFFRLVELLQKQTVPPDGIIIMNTEEKYLSSLLYGTDFLKKNPNVRIKNISRREFDHGRTRNEGARRSQADILVFMTQDAYPADEHLLEELIKPLEEESVGVSYARQLADEDSSPLEKYSRSFNYPPRDMVKSLEDLDSLGIKTYFCSNVCAAYKRECYSSLGGFVKSTPFNEDMIFAAAAMKEGWKIAYASNARVIHSHNYSGRDQLRRNFALGVSQADHPEVFSGIGSEGEGIRLVKGSARYLLQEKKLYLLPVLFWQSLCKFRGYRLGKNYRKLSHKRILKLTMNRHYWYRLWDKNSQVDVNLNKV